MIRKACLFALFLSIVGCFGSSLMAADKESTVILLPAKYSVIQFCVDVAELKPVTLIAYEVTKKNPVPNLNVWNPTRRNWTRTTLEEYRAGMTFKTVPQKAIILGNTDAVMADLQAASSAIAQVQTIKGLDSMTLANGLNDQLGGFSGSQWKWLAKRHQLKLKDFNADRRRYGKYGAPGSEGTVPVPKLESDDTFAPMPPPNATGVSVLDLPPSEAAAESAEPAKAEAVRPEDK